MSAVRRCIDRKLPACHALQARRLEFCAALTAATAVVVLAMLPCVRRSPKVRKALAASIVVLLILARSYLPRRQPPGFSLSGNKLEGKDEAQHRDRVRHSPTWLLRQGPLRRLVSFSERVTCRPVEALTGLSQEQKELIWWQPDDFAEFLRVRIEIGRAYKEVANSLGVNVLKVNSIGSHAKEAYQAMIEVAPELADESRRGLGLGRKRQRAKNRDAYIAAVLEEQTRQRYAGLYDDDKLASCAQSVSQNDREYAAHLAQMYYEQDGADGVQLSSRTEWKRERSGDTAGDGAPSAKDCTVEPATEETGEADTGKEERDPGDVQQIPRTFSEPLVDDSAVEDPLQKASPRSLITSSKGFGLSRDKLAEAGLSATGHALSKNQRQRLAPRSDLFLDSEGGESGAESDFTAFGSEDGADGDEQPSSPSPTSTTGPADQGSRTFSRPKPRQVPPLSLARRTDTDGKPPVSLARRGDPDRNHGAS